MRGRDITRLPNRASRVLFFFTLVIAAAVLSAIPARPQAQSQSTSPTPSSQNPPAKNPTPENQSAQKPGSEKPPAQAQDQQEGINDQGVFVFKKDVDEVLLHATVIDDKQHLVTNL